MLLCVAAGCVTPVRTTRPAADVALCAPPDHAVLPVRVGVEFLPPASLTALDAARSPGLDWRTEGTIPAEDRNRPTVVSLQPERTVAESDSVHLRVPWQLEPDAVDAIRDPFEQLTLRFVDDLIGADRRRMQHELGAPVLITRLRHRTAPDLWNHFDDRENEEEASYLNDVGGRLVRKPLRELLKNLTAIEDLETMLENFKADNIPLTGAYEEHRGRSGLGRISLRLRPSDGSDPVELAYVNWGLRIGSSQELFRATYSTEILRDLHASLRFKFEYGLHDTEYRADLRYLYDADTSVYVVLGDRLDFLAGPTAYSLLNTPLDGTPGVLFYVEHLF